MLFQNYIVLWWSIKQQQWVQEKVLLDYHFEMAQAEAVMLLMKCGKIIIYFPTHAVHI